VERFWYVAVLVIPYRCLDPTCTNDTAWHLLHGDFECIGMNKDAVAEFVLSKTGPRPVSVIVTCVAEGYEENTTVTVLTPVPDEEYVPPPEPTPELPPEPEPEMEM
jgi:hypothetical protein